MIQYQILLINIIKVVIADLKENEILGVKQLSLFVHTCITINLSNINPYLTRAQYNRQMDLNGL